MIATSAMPFTREQVAGTIMVYLRDSVLGDRKARINEDDNLDAVFGRTTDPVGKNAAALGFAEFVAKIYGLPRDQVAAYNPAEITVGRAVDLIYERIGGKK